MALLGDVGLQKCGVENGKFGSVRRKVSFRKIGNLFCHSQVGTVGRHGISSKGLQQHVQHKGEKQMKGNEVQKRTDFLEVVNFLPDELDSLCPGHKEAPPSIRRHLLDSISRLGRGQQWL